MKTNYLGKTKLYNIARSLIGDYSVEGIRNSTYKNYRSSEWIVLYPTICNVTSFIKIYHYCNYFSVEYVTHDIFDREVVMRRRTFLFMDDGIKETYDSGLRCGVHNL